MDATLRTELQRRLEADAEALRSRIARLEQSTTPIAPDCALGRLPRAEAMEQQAVLRSELAAARERLAAVRQALARARGDAFGHCAVCGSAIAADRLRARPETDRCRRCAEDGGSART